MNNENQIKSESRRKFIICASLTAAGAIIITKVQSVKAIDTILRNDDEIQQFVSSIWLTIDDDGTITVTNSRGEMGQGTRTTMSMIVAEELDADWSKVKAVQAQGDAKYGSQTTGGSQSVITLYNTLRMAGATAKAMLITAAAQTWGISESNCSASNSVVSEKNGSRTLTYGELADKAATLPVPPQSSIKTKNPGDFKIIGTRKSHIDSRDIATGKYKFGIDVKIPNMKYAVLALPPTVGGNIATFDDTETLKINGVLKVLRQGRGIAVIAENTWAAIKGVNALQVTWTPGGNAQYSSSDISQWMHDKIGNLPSLPGNTAKSIEAEYEVPYMAHSTMEPMNCVADYRGSTCEVWASTQSPQSVRTSMASTVGLSEANVTVNMMVTGGGFGRRLGADYASTAASISRASGYPVKFMFTKANCLKNDYYRPASVHAMKGGIDSSGQISGWIHKAVFASGGSNPSTPPYRISNPQNLSDNVSAFLSTGAWRSVNNTQVIFANECFIDELAYLAGADPLDYRLNNFGGSTKLRTVLQTLKEKSEWTKPLPNGWGRGVALFSGYGANAGHVVEVSVKNGILKVERIVFVCDNNLVINPMNVEAQLMGGAIDGLSTAIKAEITVKNGEIEQSNWHDFEWFRINESPKMEFHLIPSGGSPSGMGEVGFPSVTPALCNAIYNATGIRVRKLPISKTSLINDVEDEKKNDSGMKVYPNPFDNIVNVEFNTNGYSGNYNIEVLNILGSRIFSTSNKINGSELITECLILDSIPSAVYFVKVQIDGRSFIRKVVKY